MLPSPVGERPGWPPQEVLDRAGDPGAGAGSLLAASVEGRELLGQPLRDADRDQQGGVVVRREMSAPVILAYSGASPTWRVLLRSRERPVVARAATLAARLAAQTRGGLKVRVEIDPEEV